MRFHFNVASFVKAALVATLSVMALSACQSMSGRGDLQLISSTKRGLEAYMKEQNPDIFAASADGTEYFYYFCPTGGCVNPTVTSHKAIEKCNDRSSSPCYLLAITRNIVWQKTNGETYTLSELMSDQDRPPSLNAGTMSLCKIALDPKRQHWSQENAAAPYIAELTRRGISIDFCTKLMALAN